MKKSRSRISRLIPSIAAAAFLPSVHAAEPGFLEGSSATLQLRNYYFSRDFSDIVGASKKSKAEEWAQGFIFNYRSGYTPGAVGFGLDALAVLGVRLDSSPERSGTGLLPVHDDGKAAGEFGRIMPALKVLASNSEVRIGGLQPELPVLMYSDIRLLPPTYQGASLVSNEIPGLTLQAGRLRSFSRRDSGDSQPLYATLTESANPSRIAGITSHRFDYVGLDYSFNHDHSLARVWQGELKDIYRQRFYGFKETHPLGDWVLSATVGYYDTEESGRARAGNIDNRALYTLLSARYKADTLTLGYQSMSGADGFVEIGDTLAPLGNTLPTYDFSQPGERSWQVRDDLDFAFLGLPGLSATLRYVEGGDVRTGRGFEGEDSERDIDLSYTMHDGPLKDVSLRLRHAMARANYRSDIDENRVIVSYTMKLI
ncbi:OprD family porin [Azotobacter vinelandii]|uniref:OprD family porin n=1 Tax=Azotobacter vinelandii TaxID=354 RepID=UPI002666799E|nr:OprD family porin [Azotobacter vinelandii]WKN23030.1 OprD family porin [Azotobacter vinelandii]